MCGITGIISVNNYIVNKERIIKMMDAVAHRGPDGEGYWINGSGNVGLGHRRLSIIDLSDAGAQPMNYYPGSSSSATGQPRYTITYNGEVYNYLELKEVLFKFGYRFISQSDTEVILAAYDHWKENCVKFFDGMFSFAIWDHKEKKLFAARDRFGEKPFYYYADKEQFIFGSEMKAIWAAGIEKRTDEKMLLNYLALGYVQSSNNKGQTFFTGIYSLPPGHYLQLYSANLNVQINSYWNIDKDIKIEISSKEAIDKFAELFATSVKRRLRSDVTVGCSLSGGLDSSSIAVMIHELQKKRNGRQPAQKLQTFSAVFPGFKKDETSHIQLITNQFHFKNYQVTPSADGLIKQFETLCYHQEEPFPSSSIYAQYEVYALAKKQGVKVLLDGQGADEVLAGYSKYIQWYLQQMVARGKLGTAYREHSSLQKNKVEFNWNFKNWLAAYLPTHTAIQLEHNEYKKIVRQPDLDKNFVASLQGREWEGIYKPIITKLNDILYFNATQMGLEELLRFADRNSMAHGREVRLPFLSHELVEFVFSLPANFKIHAGFTKWILRKAMERKLPGKLVWRTDKIGFEPPQQAWMQDALLGEYMQEAKRKLVKKGILKSAVLNKKVNPQAAHEADNFNWRYLSAAQVM